MPEAVIELDGLSKWYGEVIGLNNVSARIGKGITGLLGPNGAGKSTMMGAATGQLRPSQGAIRILGERPWDNPRVLRHVGYCPEGDRFWPRMTGYDFVHFLAKASGLRGAAARSAALDAIEATSMTPHMHRAIRGYSKGMRQRIKISQALAHRPALLILDEPFTGADPVARHDLADLFRRLAADGVDVLISSHVLHEVESLTRQILMIDRGRIVAEGDVRNVRKAMHNHPHAIRVRVDQPRRVAARLTDVPAVTGMKMPEGDTLMIETTDTAAVYDQVAEIALDEQLTVLEIAAADEGLEAVFGYLTERST
jgi:ABC-2 type transport system ATP-binding protein